MKNFIFLALMLFSLTSFSQSYQVSGVVKDDLGEVLPMVNVLIEGTTNSAATDFDGKYSITVNKEDVLVFSFIGYNSKSVVMDGSTTVNVIMQKGVQIGEAAIIGSRNPNRSSVDTPVAVDVIDVSAIQKSSPQATLNEILNYVAPSFTSQTQTVSDGTDHIDPASLRGLGPDQVLVLINGKRRHNSSLINVNGTVGAGSVGTDMNAIPVAAIARIEVLRDGAAAQYGSDAIAGVINVVLKKSTKELDLSLTTGANLSENSNQFEGGMDGQKFELSANYGLPIGDKGGFINFTGSLSNREPALRNKDYAGDIFKGFHGAERVFAANGGNVADMTLADYQSAAQGIDYLSQDVKDDIAGWDLSVDSLLGGFRDLLSFDADEDELDARGLTREDFRFKVGTSKLREGKYFANMSIPLSETSSVYAFGGISYRQGLASGFYRRPAQGDGRANTIAFPNGFLPNIGSDILDKSFAIGIKGKVQDWDIDFSNTYGSNEFDITVGNSSNGTMRVATPRSFDAGGFAFNQNTTNVDLSKFHKDIFKGLNVAIGAEYKVEGYEIKAGEEASYTSYDVNGNIVTSTTDPTLFVTNNFTGLALGGGSQVYRGFDPGNATHKFRNSMAGYVDLEADFTEKFLVSVAGRFESFSDFGNTFNYKVASRYKITDKISVRAAHSTGFRAPSLHQQHFSRTSTVFIDNAPIESGVFTNDSRAATLINIPKLKEEVSSSVSGGVTARFGSFSATVDVYQINIEDRIVLSGKFGANGNAELERIFADAGANKASFFVNAIDTKSQGLEVVLSHKKYFGDKRKLTNSLAASFSQTTVETVKIPTLIEEAGLSGAFFDGQEEAFLTMAQPGVKLNLSHMLTLGKMNIMLRNVYFGEVTDPDDFNGVANVAAHTNPDPDAVYAGKIVTDLSLSTSLTDQLKFTVGVNNLLDVYPDFNREGGTSGDQFVYSRRTSQFGYSGRFVFLGFNFTLK